MLIQFPTSFFRLPLLNYPSGVIVVDRAHLKELYDAPNSSLTFFEAALEDLDFVNTFTGNAYNLYHVPVIRNQLTRGIASHVPALVEEIRSAFEDDIDPLLKKGNNAEEEWTPIPVYEMSKPLVGRISYRAFIGDSVCIFSIEFLNDRWQSRVCAGRCSECRRRRTIWPVTLLPSTFHSTVGS